MNHSRLRKILPNNRTQWVIATGLCLYVALEIIKLFLPPLNVLKPARVTWLIHQCGDAAFFVAITAAIAESLRQIRTSGFSSKYVTILAITCLIAVGLASVSVNNHYKFSQRLKDLGPNEALYSSLSRSLSKSDMTAVSRSRLSIIHAKMYFLDYGKITYYFTVDGTQAEYKPTQGEKVFREEIVRAKKELELEKSAMLRAAFIWIAAIFFGGLMGFMVLPKQKSTS